MKPSLAKGTRDFLPEDMQKRTYIFDCIRRVFQSFSFREIATPSIENLSTLMGKYGEEGDQLLFKILNNGDFLAKADRELLASKESNSVLSSISKRGLRYDLTVPFARFVVMHQNELSFPFKRYQIQPVWRADRPQKGRYQEFYQCDADIVGSKSLVSEAEFVQIYDRAFAELQVNVEIQINHRQILNGLAEKFELEDDYAFLIGTIDKWDKIGEEGVKKLWTERGWDSTLQASIASLLQENDIDIWEQALADTASGPAGIANIKTLFSYLAPLTITNKVSFVPLLARGLAYYTGCVFEVKALDVAMGSLGGGGRYDELTAIFGKKDLPGAGISFGAERIYLVMEELGLFNDVLQYTTAIILPMDETAIVPSVTLASKLRSKDIVTEVYQKPDKMKKQMKYANDLNAQYAVIIGANELENQCYTVKNMIDGQQKQYTEAELITLLTAHSDE